MTMLRLSLSFALVLSAVGLGGCAAEADGGDEPTVTVEEGTQAQAITIADRIDPSIFVPVAPQCRAVLVATGPAEGQGPNAWGCAAADPHKAQKRFTGEPEGGITVLFDQARPGKTVCVPSAILGGAPICKKPVDRLLEKTCTETRTYECPCGVVNVDLGGGESAAECRRFQL